MGATVRHPSPANRYVMSFSIVFHVVSIKRSVTLFLDCDPPMFMPRSESARNPTTHGERASHRGHVWHSDKWRVPGAEQTSCIEYLVCPLSFKATWLILTLLMITGRIHEVRLWHLWSDYKWITFTRTFSLLCVNIGGLQPRHVFNVCITLTHNEKKLLVFSTFTWTWPFCKSHVGKMRDQHINCVWIKPREKSQ